MTFTSMDNERAKFETSIPLFNYKNRFSFNQYFTVCKANIV